MRLTGRAFVAMSVLSLGTGCTEVAGSGERTVLVMGDLATDNGLSTINGLTSTNGLSTINGLTITNGLSTINGLSSTNGLMTTNDGRITVAYLVRCALPSTQTLTKQDQYGQSYTFQGAIGLAPQWQTGGCDNNCQQLISACMLAHVNTSGLHVPLWIVGQPAAVGWGLDTPTYPNQEGAFFGNIFVSPPKAYYCNGSGVSIAPAPGRIGSVQTNPPYVNAYASSDGLCATATHCAAADKPNQAAGFKTCASGGNYQPLTVWRAPWTN
jgi:hypothetical protein